MFVIFLLGTLVLVPQPQTHYKPSEEFKIELEYKFKTRPLADNAFIDLNETVRDKERRNSTSDPLPYLILHISFLQLSDQEKKVRCADNLGKNRILRKAELDKDYVLDLGYTDDVKDRVSAYSFTISLVSGDKIEASHITLLVERDGTFLVNGAKRGKF